MPDVSITPISETIFEVKINVVDPDLAEYAHEAAVSAATAVNSANIAGAAASDAEEAAGVSVTNANAAIAAKDIAVQAAGDADAALQQIIGIDNTILHKSGDETKNGSLTIVGKQNQAYTDKRFDNTRPVVNDITLYVDPDSPIEQTTDFHGFDIKFFAQGDNVNNFTRLYPFQINSSNISNSKILRIVNTYLLGENNSPNNSGVGDITNLRLWIRNNVAGTIDSVKNIEIETPRNNGGGVITNAYGIYIKNFNTASNHNYGIYSLANNYFRKIEVGETGMVTNLNSQFVGGKNGDHIVAGNHSSRTTAINGGDLNNINKSGFYSGNNLINSPVDANYFSVQHIQMPSSSFLYATQIAVGLTGDQKAIYLRNQNNGTWSSWKKISRDTYSENGTALKLDNPNGTIYNYASPETAATFTTTIPVVGGFARCFVNRATEPTVTGATKVFGDDFIPNTKMEMRVESLDGVTVEYRFIRR